jgi:hypothetical protein
MRFVFIICMMALVSSCGLLKLTECKYNRQWDIEQYHIVEANCIGPVGPRYYPVSLYKGKKLIKGQGYKSNDCSVEFQPSNDLFLSFDICNNTYAAIKPARQKIDIKIVDSAFIFSLEKYTGRLLKTNAISGFIKDWNKSEPLDYRSGNPDSVFHPSFQYIILIYTPGKTYEFMAFNHLVSDRTNWVYSINRKDDPDYFDKLWKSQ